VEPLLTITGFSLCILQDKHCNTTCQLCTDSHIWTINVAMGALLLTIVVSHKKSGKNVLDFQGFGKTTRILGLKNET